MVVKLVFGLVALVLIVGCTSAPIADVNQSVDQNNSGVMIPPTNNDVNQKPVIVPPTDLNQDQNVSDQNTDQNVTVPVVPSEITTAELATHNTQDNCWVAFEGKVYDLTAWLPKHPGSAAAIAPYCGTSEEFEAAFTGKHGMSKVTKLDQEGVLKGDLAP